MAAFTLEPIYPEDYGAIADCLSNAGGGTDNGPPITQALQVGQTTGRPVLLGLSGLHYGVATPIAWHGGVNQTLCGPWPARRGPTDTARGPWLWGTGGAMKTLIELYGMACTVRGLGFGCADGSSLDRLFDVDNPLDLNIPYITSMGHVWECCHLEGGYGPVHSGIVNADTNANNGEFMACRSCRFTDFQGAGFQNNSRYGQSFGNEFTDCSFEVSRNGYASAVSSAVFRGCNFNALQLALWFNGGSFAPVVVDQCTSENCERFFYGWGCTEVTIRDSRLALNACRPGRPAPLQEWVVGGNDLRIEHVDFDSLPAGNNGFCLRAGDNGTLTLAGQVFHEQYLPVAIDNPPRFSVLAEHARYSTGDRQVPQGLWRQDNLPNPYQSGVVSQLAPLTALPVP